MPTIKPLCSSCLLPSRFSRALVIPQPLENALLRTSRRKVYLAVPISAKKRRPPKNPEAFFIHWMRVSQNSKRTANSISRAPNEPVVGPAVDVRFPNVPGLVGSMESEESAKLTLLKML